MFSRWKTRIVPEVQEADVYTRRRYEDLAVCIAHDIASNRGLFCYYTPWLDHMMGKYDLSQEYRARHSLVATDSQGKHIGCSGAVKNTLVYYNLSPPGHEGEVQFEEAVRKSCLSAKFKRIPSEGRGRMGSTNGLVRSEEATFRPSNNDKATVCLVRSSDMREYLYTAEDVLFDSEPHPVTPITDQREQERQQYLQPHYIDEDGTVHMVSELRPLSANSYYARIDEAFRNHRARTSKLTSSVTNVEHIEDSCITEGRASHDNDCSQIAVELDTTGNKEKVAKSKFCTIL